MKNHKINLLILTVSLLLAVSCMIGTSASDTKATTTTVPEELTPTSGEAAESTGVVKRELSNMRAVLEIPSSLPLGEPVRLQFLLANDSDSRLFLLNWFTPLEGLGGEIFRVSRDGEIVPYQGPLVSRVEPGPDSYTMVEAGEIVSAEVDLSMAYDFSIPGNYTIKFISPRISHVAKSEGEMAKTFDELGPVQIPTNEVAVEIVAEDSS